MTAQELRDQVRVEEGEDDSKLWQLAKLAREYCERANEVLLTTATVEQHTTFTHAADLDDAVRLVLSPVATVSSVTIEEPGESSVAIDSANYEVVPDGEGVYLFPVNTITKWSSRIGTRVVVTYTGGLAVDSVAEVYKQAMLMLVAHYYENREAVLTGTISKEVEHGVERLLRLAEIPSEFDF